MDADNGKTKQKTTINQSQFKSIRDVINDLGNPEERCYKIISKFTPVKN
jgi:hypothetical protein